MLGSQLPRNPRNVPYADNARGAGLATLYGLGIYLAYDSGLAIGALAFSFIFIVPIIIGVLTVFFAPQAQKLSMPYGIFAPWIVCILLSSILVFIQFEVIICICMAMVIYLPLASFGGGLMVQHYKRQHQEDLMDYNKPFMGALLLLPLAFVSIEALLPSADAIRTVERETIIYADPAVIWDTMITVPEIAADEADYSWFQHIGMPRPVEATLEGEGVGAVRIARYDNGLILREPITVWEPEETLIFAVEVTDNAPKPYGQVGGENFDVLEVGFRLEPQADGGVKVHLHTTYRLTTGVNFYGQLWVDHLMGDLQEYILTVIKQRAEQVSR